MKINYLSLLLAVPAIIAAPFAAVAGTSKVSGLEDAFAAVIAQHPAVSGKRAEVSARGFDGDSARAGRYPSLNAQAGYLDDGTHSVMLVARQPLWAFGRIDSAIDYADTNMLVEQADLLRVKRDLLDRTATAYAQLLGVHQRRQVLIDNIATHEQFYEQIKRREQGKLASRVDVKVASIRLIQARSQKKRIEGDILMAMNELQALTQLPLGEVIPVDAAMVNLPAAADAVEELAMENSADIQHKNRLLSLAKSNTDVEKTASMPTIYLQADKQFNQLGYRNGTRYSVMVEMNLDGMGFSSYGRAKAALSHEIAATSDVQNSRNELVRTVRSLLNNRQTQRELAEVLKESVSEFNGILDSYMRQYEIGHKAWLDVLNIQRELTDQRLQQVQAENDWLVYSLRLKALIGGFDGFIEDPKE